MSEAASIKVQPDTKRLLDELQADLTRETGRKVTLQDLTEALARLGREEQDRLVALFVDRPRVLTRAQVDRLLSCKFDFPVEVRPEELDDLIYGFPRGPDHPETPGAKRLHRRLKAARSGKRGTRRRKARG